jgi:hypothetical protein
MASLNKQTLMGRGLTIRVKPHTNFTTYKTINSRDYFKLSHHKTH